MSDTPFPRKTLNIIGAGHVGMSLAHLWHRNGVFTVQDITNRSLESARRAVTFIGAGHAVSLLSEMEPADVWMIGVGDDMIRPCCEQLAALGKLHSGAIAFHCSGAWSSAELDAARLRGAAIASIHPIRSFAAPERVIDNFAETWCGAEGDVQALEILAPAFVAIGAHVITINPSAKTVYHAAAVFACNYLVTLLDIGVNAYGAAGVSPETALKIMEPLVRGTVNNVFRVGPISALTGPIARGDLATAEKQSHAVHAWNKEYGALYDQFMKLTIELATRRKE